MHSLCPRLALTRGFSQSFILRLSSTYFILPHTSSMCPQTQRHTSSVLTGLLMGPLTRLKWKASSQYPAGAGSRGRRPVPTTHHLDAASLGLLNINPSHPQSAFWAKGHRASSWPSPLNTLRAESNLTAGCVSTCPPMCLLRQQRSIKKRISFQYPFD